LVCVYTGALLICQESHDGSFIDRILFDRGMIKTYFDIVVGRSKYFCIPISLPITSTLDAKSDMPIMQ